jgi:serine/threonine protein phosphatase PrpC
VVTRKKKTKYSISPPIKFNQWIESVEHESYQGLRDYNEDRLLAELNIPINNTLVSLFAIFDGHGGSAVSEYLKLNFLDIFVHLAKSM